MILKSAMLALVSATALVVLPGCAVTRGQQTVGSYVDDAAVTTAVKAKFVEDPTVDAASISVETLQGTVMLSGFAKSAMEKSAAERIARGVKGVKSVKNELAIRS